MAVAKEQIRQIISENNINSVADIYTLLKDSFKDIPQELMEAELDATPGYEKNQRVDIVVWMEDNICIYRYGEILHTSAVLVGTIHVIQGIYINWREPAFSSVVCKQKVCLTTKRRMAKEMQVVGGPNSTDEGMNKINTRGKSRENCSSQFWPAKLYQRGNISYTQR